MMTTDWSRLVLASATSQSPVWLLTCGGVLVVALYVAIDRLTLSQREKAHRATVVAPDTWPIVGNTLSVLAHTHEHHEWGATVCAAMQGRPFRSKIIGSPEMIILSTPQHFEDVLKTHFANFPKGDVCTERLHDLLGDGIFAVDGETWVHQRKTASNLFTMRMLRDSMAATVHQRVADLETIFHCHAEQDTVVDVFKLLNAFTLDVFAQIGFGVELGCLTSPTEHSFHAAFDSAQRMLTWRFLRPSSVWKLQRWLNVGSEAQLKKDIRMIHDTVMAIISKSLERRSTQQGRQDAADSRARDIVSLFLANVGDDQEFDPVLLRDVVVNFLIAGRDTTAQALSWFFYLVSQHPDVEARIRADMKLESESPPPAAGSQRQVYLEAALKETLRLYPSVPANIRMAAEDCTLHDGTFVKAGTIVELSSYSLGRMEHVWGPDAKEFRPERWIDASTGKLRSVSPFQFNSFHAGPRTCLGMNLAMMEMKMVVSKVLRKFHLELEPDQHITYDLSLTLPMKNGLHMRASHVE